MKWLRNIVLLLIVVATFVAYVYLFLMASIHRTSYSRVAIGSLRTIAIQEAVFSQQCEVNQDKDRVGEYGFLSELCGEICPRNSIATVPVNPVYISQGFRTQGKPQKGTASKSGYCFQLWLPGPDGPMSDADCDGTQVRPGTQLNPKTHSRAINLQEQHFVIYAWPLEYGSTGLTAFAVNESAEVYATHPPYSSELPFVVCAAAAALALLTAIVMTFLRLSAPNIRVPLWAIVLAFLLWPTGFCVGLVLRPREARSGETAVKYSGMALTPKPDASFRKGEPVFTGQFGDGEGNDGNHWTLVD